jgi:Fe-S metabolism associated domain
MMLENILADFELLDDWEDRYRYVIELGRSLPPLPEAARAEANKMRGRRPAGSMRRRSGAANVTNGCGRLGRCARTDRGQANIRIDR